MLNILKYICLCTFLTKLTCAEDEILFPSLPIVIKNSDNNLCENESDFLDQHLKKNTFWAYEMYDSSAKFTMGTLYGNTYHLGNYDECLSITEPIQVQYCLVKVKIILKTNYTVLDPYSLSLEYYNSVFENIQYTNDPNKLRRDETHLGLCLPKSCSTQNVQKSLQHYLQQNFSNNYKNYLVTVNSEDCYTNENIKFDIKDIGFCLVSAILVVIVITCTILDYKKDHQGESIKSKNMKLIQCFSVRVNLRELFQADKSPLAVLYGTKVIMMCGIVVAHTVENAMTGSVFNIRSIELINRSLILMPLLRGEIIVDLFLMFSGLLATYCYMIQAEKRDVSKTRIILLRYFRLVPMLAFLTFFYASIYSKLGSGPLWNRIVEREKQFCEKNWWTNLLLINNYFDTNNLCILQSWYMSCDFQLFIIAVFLNPLIKKNYKLGLSILSVLLGGTTIITFFIIYLGQKDPFIYMFNSYFYYFRQIDFFKSVYAPAHTRAPSYFFGMLYGYVYYRLRFTKFQIPKGKSIMISITYFWIVIGCLFGGAVFYNPYRSYQVLEGAVYACLHRSVFTMGAGLMLLVLTHGYLDFFRKVLTWWPMVPLGKLTFGAYLTHMAFQLVRVGGAKLPTVVNFYTWISTGTIDVILGMISALVLYLLIENPFSKLAKELLSDTRKSEKTPVATPSVENSRISIITRM